jgi:apolipoprotein N-acyltransferase
MAVVTAPVQGYTGATPYVRVGNRPVLGLTALMLVAAWLYSRRRTRNR